jgi:hypothetical protein
VRVAGSLLAALACACVGDVTPAQCAIDADCGATAFCSAGACLAGTRECPELKPTFSSINTSLLQVGCGSKARNCHASDSAAVQSGPSFARDAHQALVNAPAANRLGIATGLVLVVPGDPDHSFLLRKLRLTAVLDPLYGGGQPASAPGSLCAADLAVIEQWIRAGALDD